MRERTAELTLKVLSIKALRSIVRSYGLKRTSEILKLSPVVISRYTNGRTLPKLERAREILGLFNDVYLKDVVERRLHKRDGVINIADILHDIQLLDLIAYVAFNEYYGLGVNKVITKEVDGIPLATLIARYLEARLVIAKRRKELGIEKFLEIRQVFESGLYSYIYVPSNHLQHGDHVLIVDDIIRSGSTVKALIKAIRDRRADVSGIFSIVAFSSGLNSIEDMGLKVKAIVTIT